MQMMNEGSKKVCLELRRVTYLGQQTSYKYSRIFENSFDFVSRSKESAYDNYTYKSCVKEVERVRHETVSH